MGSDNQEKKPHGLTGKANASQGKEDWEKFYPRAPKGTKARIVKACEGGKIADWLTQAILEKLEREGF